MAFVLKDSADTNVFLYKELQGCRNIYLKDLVEAEACLFFPTKVPRARSVTVGVWCFLNFAFPLCSASLGALKRT